MMDENDDIEVKCSILPLNNVDGVLILINKELMEFAKKEPDFFTKLGRKFDEELIGE